MSKILTVYCLLCLQPEQVPFSLSDVWKWLSRTVNILSRTKSTYLFFTATILELVIKITGKKLFEVYGENFMIIIKHIYNNILPKMPNDMAKRVNLNDFLEKFIKSNGKEYIPYFLAK